MNQGTRSGLFSSIDHYYTFYLYYVFENTTLFTLTEAHGFDLISRW